MRSQPRMIMKNTWAIPTSILVFSPLSESIVDCMKFQLLHFCTSNYKTVWSFTGIILLRSCECIVQCRSAWYLFVRLLFSCLHHCKENTGPETKIPLGMVLRPANLRVLPWTKAPQGVSSLHFWKVYPPYSCLSTCKVCNPNPTTSNCYQQPFFWRGIHTF